MPRRHLPSMLVIAAALAVLPGCGGRSHLIPQTDAAALSAKLREIDGMLLKRQCDGLPEAIGAAQQTAAALPASVDRALRERIDQGLTRLARQAPRDCAGAETTTTKTTDTTTVTTETQTTATDTTPVTTDTTPAPAPTPTETTPTTPAPTPTATTPTPTTPAGGGGGGAGGTGGGSGGSGGGTGGGSGGGAAPGGATP